MAKTDDTTTDKQTPTTEPIAPQEPSEAVADVIHGLQPDIVTHEGASRYILPDPFVGSWQPNATVVESWWAGLPNYQCSLCQYAHLDRERTAAHVFIHGQTFTQGARP